MLNEQRTGDFFVFDKRINYQTKDYNGLIKNNGVLEMENTTRIKEMTWFEYARRTDDWFILPVGAVEQHGRIFHYMWIQFWQKNLQKELQSRCMV